MTSLDGWCGRWSIRRSPPAGGARRGMAPTRAEGPSAAACTSTGCSTTAKTARESSCCVVDILPEVGRTFLLERLLDDTRNDHDLEELVRAFADPRQERVAQVALDARFARVAVTAAELDGALAAEHRVLARRHLGDGRLARELAPARLVERSAIGERAARMDADQHLRQFALRVVE